MSGLPAMSQCRWVVENLVGVSEVVVGPIPTASESDGGDAGAPRRFNIVRRVADHHSILCADVRSQERRGHDVRITFRLRRIVF